MEKEQKTRMLLLVLSGLLLTSVAVFWTFCGRQSTLKLPYSISRISSPKDFSVGKSPANLKITSEDILDLQDDQITSKRSYLVTKREDALTSAQENLGRFDPFVRRNIIQPIQAPVAKPKDGKSSPKQQVVLCPPPPPPVFQVKPQKPATIAPRVPKAAKGSNIDIDLGFPPVKEPLSAKVKLIAIIGDKVVLQFTDKELAFREKWPELISLLPGEQFESVNLISVEGNTVTLEEDGERQVKTMPPIH